MIGRIQYMNKQKGIFNATFQESSNLVTKKSVALTEEKNGLKTMKFSNKIIGSFLGLTFFSVWSYVMGIGMAEGMLNANAKDIHIISVEGAHVIGLVGTLLKPLTISLISFWILAIVINLFPKKDYSIHYAWGTIFLIAMMFLFSTSLFSLTVGFTVDGLGWLGLILLSIFGILLIIKTVRNCRANVLTILFQQKNSLNNKMNKLINIYICACFIILLMNRFSFRLGFVSENSTLISLFYGCAILIFWGLVTLCIYIMFPRIIGSVYLIKYSEQYKEYFEITNEQWYGKRKAKRLEKRRKKENQNDK